MVEINPEMESHWLISRAQHECNSSNRFARSKEFSFQSETFLIVIYNLWFDRILKSAAGFKSEELNRVKLYLFTCELRQVDL